MAIPSWDDCDEPGDRLGEAIFGRIKAELDPMEFLLWADRPDRPRRCGYQWSRRFHLGTGRTERLFAGGALRPVGEAWLDLRTLAGYTWPGPHRAGQHDLHTPDLPHGSPLAEAPADWREWSMQSPITGPSSASIENSSGELQACSLSSGDIIDARRFENPDGSGDLYFIGRGLDQWLRSVSSRFARSAGSRPSCATHS